MGKFKNNITMKKIFFRLTVILYVVVLSFSVVSCLENDVETIILRNGKISEIPSDDWADPNPEIGNSNTDIPNPNFVLEYEDEDPVVRVDMTGIRDNDKDEWLKLFGTGYNQNIWVEVDNKPKGILVYNNSDDESNIAIKIDLVFLVDNSGSMSEEADAIARDIISWAEKLRSSGLDIKFGCVGYDGLITGALNLTTVTELSNYLNRTSGTKRTVGFVGSDADRLKNAKYSYDLSSQDECGGAALRYADEQFTFRTGANRIYVNFTDEPNFPKGKDRFSVESFKDSELWSASQGTVHTVFSSSKSSCGKEYPWKLSEYTGGTIIETTSSFANVSLESLPVTGAMQNSYIIKFANVAEFMDGKSHLVKITVLSEDGLVRAERTFSVLFGKK